MIYIFKFKDDREIGRLESISERLLSSKSDIPSIDSSIDASKSYQFSPGRIQRRHIRLPNGTWQFIEDDGKPKSLIIGAGGFGICPVCKFEIRLADPSKDCEGQGIFMCPICKINLTVSYQR